MMGIIEKRKFIREENINKAFLILKYKPFTDHNLLTVQLSSENGISLTLAKELVKIAIYRLDNEQKKDNAKL